MSQSLAHSIAPLKKFLIRYNLTIVFVVAGSIAAFALLQLVDIIQISGTDDPNYQSVSSVPSGFDKEPLKSTIEAIDSRLHDTERPATLTPYYKQDIRKDNPFDPLRYLDE